MREVFKNIILKCFLLLMAFQILNQSIDAIDFQPIYTSNNIGNFNDINSVTEYVSEIILGNTNAFPEFQKTPTSKTFHSFKHISLKIFDAREFTFEPQAYLDVLSFAFPLDEQYSFQFSKEINPPPPKA
ncbi:MAG: hypothetical protein H7068_10320 [Pedobacter sp.]|nr:hypothetical protein [Chitinophagaceae bacterium]